MNEEDQRRQDAIHAVTVHVILGLLLIVMFLWVIPAFATLLRDFNCKLPYPTQAVIQVSDLLRSPAGMILLIIVVPGYTCLDWKCYLWIHRRHGKTWANTYSGIVVLAVVGIIPFLFMVITLPFAHLHFS